MTSDEYNRQLSDPSVRFYVRHTSDDGAFNYELVDRKTGLVVGSDGGEPEDQLLVRDWAWVAEAMNRLALESPAASPVEGGKT